MNWIKSVFLSLLALFLFFGTVGVDIFSHFCEKDGMEVSYFIKDESICGAHDHDAHHEKQEETSCCDEQEDNNCCNTIATHVQVKLDFSQNTLLKLILFAETAKVPVWHLETEFPAEVLKQAANSDPPPLKEQIRLAKIQKWLI